LLGDVCELSIWLAPILDWLTGLLYATLSPLAVVTVCLEELPFILDCIWWALEAFLIAEAVDLPSELLFEFDLKRHEFVAVSLEEEGWLVVMPDPVPPVMLTRLEEARLFLFTLVAREACRCLAWAMLLRPIIMLEQ
jgi:hypothetical protein